MKILLLGIFYIFSFQFLKAQDAATLVGKLKEKLQQVHDYEATGVLKTDVAFIKAPAGKVIVYYKSPDKISLKRQSGISILPKGGMNVNMASLMSFDYLAIDAGEAVVNGVHTRIIKLLPNDESSELVLSTLYIDPVKILLLKSITTTKSNGTYEMLMTYGKYEQYGLPDKVIFSFNTKDYKIPKGFTLEFNDADKAELEKMKNKKGKVEITYSSYSINKGIPDTIFNK
ncbi:MAG: hypothetical protein JSS67_02615 [Bacteroidetes bacterium]|nr:hypothetical protein [Bacteroidota bacterium]